ncbi:DUF5627 domain-containing protein [uncultured Polaribacter sp.]|uniref:DUF5627 domain-containing protein n=1 Tax=uncultured Polaribacter sp. TaxID=174711 RepID=UPI0026134097|nr:DUF5627 domain-containing protein [uncultured Polaribacter sp.]
MKNKLLIIFAFALVFMACENQESDFPDFGSTSVYFPFQTPVRTLIQGKYDLGFNDNDNNGRFEIGVTMSGVYNNNIDRKVNFEVDTDIINPTILGGISTNVVALPESYYTIEQESPLTIPAGSIKGRIPVQLTDAFFDDPLSFVAVNDSVNYVIPLKITNFVDLDSLLIGVPNEGIAEPKRVIANNWSILPKDYTLFGIKFMNKYQGIYLRRGEDKVVGSTKVVKTGFVNSEDETVVDGSTVYRSEFVVRDEITSVSTAGRNKAISINSVRRPGIPSNSNVSLLLTFNDSEDITITSADENSPFVVTGTGKFVENGDEWGGEKRDVIYLEYEYQDKVVENTKENFNFTDVTSTIDLFHTVKDTLVIRDRDVKFEEFTFYLNE